MKRFISIVLCLSLFCALFSLPASADASTSSERPTILVFADGSWCVTSIIVLEENASDCMERSEITGLKTKDYYNANGAHLFSATVKGTFTYNGNTATATSSQYGYQIIDNTWSFSSAYAFCSGATATASCTFTNPYHQNRTVAVSLTCSPTGILS